MLEALLWLVFILSAILLVVVVLLQEPKGGGLAEAFCGMGAQTFGVKATGITKFTAYVGIVFVLSAIILTCHKSADTAIDLAPSETPGPEFPGGPPGAGPADTGAPPPAKPEEN